MRAEFERQVRIQSVSSDFSCIIVYSICNPQLESDTSGGLLMYNLMPYCYYCSHV